MYRVRYALIWVKKERICALVSRMRQPPAASFERLDHRLEIYPQRLVIMQDRRNLAINPEQLVDRHLGDPNRIFDREHDVLGDFNELADEGEILRRFGCRQRPVGGRARHEHAGDIGQAAWNAGGFFEYRAIEVEV